MQHQDLNINGLKVVVFDWDNTLAESRSTLVFAINQILPEYNLPEWEIVKAKRDNNLSFKDNFPRIFGEKAQEAYDKYVKIYLKHVDNKISAFPKTQEVLTFFKERNILLMIMSNKERRLLEYELPILFDPQIFDNIVCGHEAQEDKPHGQHLIWTLQNFIPAHQINPKQVWMVGDSPQDSSCAKHAGARAIRIGKSIWDEEDKSVEDILFFDSFVDFYESLLLSNPK